MSLLRSDIKEIQQKLKDAVDEPDLARRRLRVAYWWSSHVTMLSSSTANSNDKIRTAIVDWETLDRQARLKDIAEALGGYVAETRQEVPGGLQINSTLFVLGKANE